MPGWQFSVVFADSTDGCKEIRQARERDIDSDADEACALMPLQAAASNSGIAFCPRAGQKVLTMRGGMPRETGFKQMLCADIDSFSLQRCRADEREALEQACRYVTRPALAKEHVQTNAAGQVVLKLKSQWRHRTNRLVISRLEFIQRLAMLVPRPRLHPSRTA